MAAFTDEDKQRVREASDLVEIVGERVPLKRKGRDYWCCCPFHHEKTPSCKIDPATGWWHCFGCGEGGDVFSFIMKIEDIDFPDAVRFLADRANIELHETGGPSAPKGQKGRLKEICAETARFYHAQLMRNPHSDAAAARDYLSGRGLGGSVPKTWSLGYAPGKGMLVKHLRSKGFTPADMEAANVAVSDRRSGGVRDRFYNRVMFPIFNVRGECVAFGGRVIGSGEPKYLNSSETSIFHKSEVLYGLDKAKASMTATGTAIVVEGYTDVIALHEAGVTNAVATLGTALTRQHIHALSRHAQNRIVYLFDGDAAGQRAADRALQFIDKGMTEETRNKTELMAVTLPDDLDPADFIAQRGKEAFDEQMKGAQSLIMFGMKRRLAENAEDTPEARSRAAIQALSILAPIKDSLLAKEYTVQLAGMLGMRDDALLEALANIKAPRPVPDEPNSTQSVAPASADPIEDKRFSDLPQQTQTRLHYERAVLCLCARRVDLANSELERLAQIKWYSKLYASIADRLIVALAETPDVSPSALLDAIAQDIPDASRVLTAGTDYPNDSEALRFNLDALTIQDLEKQIGEYRMRLAAAPDGSEEADTLTKTVYTMQQQLTDLRVRHRAGMTPR